MVMALGETYEKLERLQEAKKCFWKAHSIGDIEGLALIKLAKYVQFQAVTFFSLNLFAVYSIKVLISIGYMKDSMKKRKQLLLTQSTSMKQRGKE